MLVAGIEMIATSAVANSSLWVRWAMTLLPMALRIGTGALWLFWMTPASDADPQLAVLSEEEMARQTREAELSLRLIEAEMRNALRGLD